MLGMGNRKRPWGSNNRHERALFRELEAKCGSSGQPSRRRVPLLIVAAVGGDAVNYWVGSKIGARAAAGKIPYVKKEYIERTHAFYERYGARTVVLARFIPIVRTFAPFVAGAGSMTYRRFAAYNVIGGVAWVGSMLFAGYLFGNIPVVKENFSLVVLGIIGVSILPGVVAVVQERRRGKAERTLP